MHTRNKPGINFDVAADPEANFTWVPPLASEGDNIDDYLAGLEARTPEDLDEALVALEREKIAVANESIDGYEVLECNVYDFEELAQVEQGLIPKSIEDEISVVDCSGDNGENTWNIDSLMSTEGVSAAEVRQLPVLPAVPAELHANTSAHNTIHCTHECLHGKARLTSSPIVIDMSSNSSTNVFNGCATDSSAITTTCCNYFNSTTVTNSAGQVNCEYGGQLPAVAASLQEWIQCAEAHNASGWGCQPAYATSPPAPTGSSSSAGTNNVGKAVLGLLFVGAVIQAITVL
ncbi:hypothetical protein BJ138DRAFT_1119448 [Hygrophoropsis aurantiaca]|uniref:Uncharacterized protein n=1 Tax=Hygrophoropsis aurantiaca TaxID=72124 RepID=A0ACB7ZTC2_9AGAM|nr:hypothetical protein BJ138DRAFT_1119448 [Hygrophoropsis aurantiaca]